MVAAAAGMAASGLVPVVSAFAFLLSLRTGDQVNSLVAYNNLNVKLVGGYAGLSDFADGASHQSVSDLAIMRSLPNMTILAPADIRETRACVKAMLEYQGPVYLRLSREAVGDISAACPDFMIGRGVLVRDGEDLTIATTGTVLTMAIRAAELLEKDGICARVIHLPTVKPLDERLILESAEKTGAFVVVEEHSIIGGLGSAISEVLVANMPVPVRFCGLRDCFGESGNYAEILSRAGLDSADIAAASESVIKMKG